MNTLKTTFLLSLLTVLMVLMGSAIGGKTGMVFAFFLAAAMNFFSYWFSDRIVLAMYGAREITENDNPSFYGMVRRLAVQAGLPMPRVYLIPSDSPNAFATGRNPSHAAVDRQSVDRLLPAPALFHAPSHGRADRQAGSNSAWWQTGVAVETYPDRKR